MTAGLYGLAGVLLGGLLTIGWQWWTEKRQRAVMVRHVAMALNDELLWLEAGLGRVLVDGQLHRLDRQVSELHAMWKEHQLTIAHFDTKTWGCVRVAMRALDRLTGYAASREAGPMLGLERAWAETTRGFVVQARTRLADKSGLNPPDEEKAQAALAAYGDLVDLVDGVDAAEKAPQDPAKQETGR